MNSFDCYKLFLGINNHFTKPSYDYFKYGSVPVKLATYDAKPAVDHYRFDRLAKKFSTVEELENFLVANIIDSKKRLWIGQFFGGDADEKYLLWQGRVQSVQYKLTSEVKKLVEDHNGFNCLFRCEPGQHPEILKSQMRGDISMENFVILDMCVNFFPRLDRDLADDRSWMTIRNTAIKYRPFVQRLNISLDHLRKVLVQAVADLGVTS